MSCLNILFFCSYNLVANLYMHASFTVTDLILVMFDHNNYSFPLWTNACADLQIANLHQRSVAKPNVLYLYIAS